MYPLNVPYDIPLHYTLPLPLSYPHNKNNRVPLKHPLSSPPFHTHSPPPSNTLLSQAIEKLLSLCPSAVRTAVTASVYPIDHDHHLTGDLSGRGENLTGDLTGDTKPAAFTILNRTGPEPLFSLRNSGFTLPMGPNYRSGANSQELSTNDLSTAVDDATMVITDDNNTSNNNNNNNYSSNNNNNNNNNTSTHHTDHYILTARSVRENLRRLLRAMQLPRPILLEGPPGVGKTSIISNLAKLTGHTLVSSMPCYPTLTLPSPYPTSSRPILPLLHLTLTHTLVSSMPCYFPYRHTPSLLYSTLPYRHPH